MRNNSNSFIWIILLAVAVMFVVGRWFRTEESFTSLPLPPLMAEGWLNAAGAPTEEQLRGKLVVIDSWATWCGYCVKELPALIEFQRQAGDKVQVIGLTPEAGGEATTVRQFVENQPEMNWPIGYGASPTLDALGVRGFPTYYLFDRNGILVWQGHEVRALEEEVVKRM